MKYLLTVLLFLAMCSNSFAQYERAMRAAKDFERQGEFYKAILTYNTANVCPDKPKENPIAENIKYCGVKLNLLKTQADNAKKQIQNLLTEADNAKDQAIKDKEKAEKLEQKAQKALEKAEDMQIKNRQPRPKFKWTFEPTQRSSSMPKSKTHQPFRK